MKTKKVKGNNVASKSKKVKLQNTGMKRLFNIKGLVIIIALVSFSIGGYFILFSKASGPVTNTYNPPNIYLSPTTQPLQANQTFQVQVRANSGTTSVNAIEADFTYPASLIDIVSIDTTTSAYQTQAVNSGALGNVSIARAQIGGLTGDQLVAIITFKAKTTGGNVSLSFVNGTELISSSNNTNILPSLSSAYGATYKIDTLPPVVSVTSPANNTNIELGATQNITVSATDADSDVQKVEFYIDGILKNTITSATGPYAYSWSTVGVTEGAHTIYAKAYDQFNFVAQSTTINTTVSDKTTPTVSITAPINNALVSGIVTINATASDNTNGSGLAKVEFYQGTTLINTDTASPFTFAWDSKTSADGAYSLTAKAYDKAGTPNVKTSTAVSVNVDNADKTAPTQPGSFKTTAIGLQNVSLSWTASTDNVGVTAYKVTRNGTQVYNGTALTFADDGLAKNTQYTYSVTAVDGAGNSSTASTLTAKTLTPKPGDVNSDNVVNVQDLSIVISRWGTNDATADLNKNGRVDISDISIIISNWGL